MDGVLANFDKHYFDIFGVWPSKESDNVDWDAVREYKDFYASMPPMPDMPELWGYVSKLTPQPIVLTGIPKSVDEAATNKLKWAVKYLGATANVICCPSKDKSLWCHPGDVLIDDWPKYRDRWLNAGGHWITYTSAADSIEKLKQLGITP